MPVPNFTHVYRLVADPALQTRTSKNLPVLRLRLASDSNRRDPYTGVWEKTGQLFIDAELWERNAAELHTALAKGDAVVVAGDSSRKSGRRRPASAIPER